MKKKFIIWTIFLLIIILYTYLYHSVNFLKTLNESQNIFKAVFLDVKQGDSLIMISPDGRVALLDAGNRKNKYHHFDAGDTVILPFLKRWHIHELDYIILTHDDIDHIGGVLSVLKKIKVHRLYMNITDHLTQTSQQIIHLCQIKKIPIDPLTEEDFLTLGKDVYIQVLSPEKNRKYKKDNNQSIVLRASYKNTDILLTADIEGELEHHLMSRYSMLESEVLKIPHHGSKTSSLKPFLQKVNSDLCVISVGKKNSYGHPSQEVLNKIKNLDVDLYQTSIQGHIALLTDGFNIQVVSQY